MPSWSVTSEKVISCVPEAAGGAAQQVACSAVIGVPSASVVAPAIAAKDRHNTTMPAASRETVRPMVLPLITDPSPSLPRYLLSHVSNHTTCRPLMDFVHGGRRGGLGAIRKVVKAAVVSYLEIHRLDQSTGEGAARPGSRVEAADPTIA